MGKSFKGGDKRKEKEGGRKRGRGSENADQNITKTRGQQEIRIQLKRIKKRKGQLHGKGGKGISLDGGSVIIAGRLSAALEDQTYQARLSPRRKFGGAMGDLK